MPQEVTSAYIYALFDSLTPFSKLDQSLLKILSNTQMRYYFDATQEFVLSTKYGAKYFSHDAIHIQIAHFEYSKELPVV